MKEWKCKVLFGFTDELWLEDLDIPNEYQAEKVALDIMIDDINEYGDEIREGISRYIGDIHKEFEPASVIDLGQFSRFSTVSVKCEPLKR